MNEAKIDTSTEIEEPLSKTLKAIEADEAGGASPESSSPAPEPEIISPDEATTTDDTPEKEAASPVADNQKEGEDAEEIKSHLLRMAADFENYKKRTRQEAENIRRFGNEQLIRDILPTLDNLARALQHASSDANQSLGEGVRMVLQQLTNTLENYGVLPIKSVNSPFNPEFHEALGQLENAEVEPGTVVQEYEKGYTLNGRLLRPARVMVAKAPAATPAPTPEAEASDAPESGEIKS